MLVVIRCAFEARKPDKLFRRHLHGLVMTDQTFRSKVNQ